MYTFTTAAGWKEEALLQTEALRLEVLFSTLFTPHKMVTQTNTLSHHTQTKSKHYKGRKRPAIRAT